MHEIEGGVWMVRVPATRALCDMHARLGSSSRESQEDHVHSAAPDIGAGPVRGDGAGLAPRFLRDRAPVGLNFVCAHVMPAL